jgi:dTDP-4-amino-4,6-dideoxygalactose transaminase
VSAAPAIPQCDPRAGYRAHRDEIDAAVRRVLDGGRYILGDEVGAFERDFAAYVGVPHAIGVGSGTDALVLALRCLGIGTGDAVATVAHTAVATVAAIRLAGAEPLLVDVDPDTHVMDPAALARLLESPAARRLRAVVPVHLYGHPADMAAIGALAARAKLAVIEDCAQAHGAAIDGHRVGGFGDFGAFSFYPTKNLGAFGDGGALVCRSPQLAEAAHLVRQYGWKERYVSAREGMNTRLDELHAAVLRVRLRYLDADNARRRAIAQRYDAALGTADLGLPAARAGCTHVYHQYVVRTRRRDELRAKLGAHGIGTLIHYPVPVHRQPAYAALAGTALPVTEQLCGEILSLPMFPELADEQIERVIGAVADFAARAR